MTRCLFATDLHGDLDRYSKLLQAIEEGRPSAVFLGGDLLPGFLAEAFAPRPGYRDFINDVMAPGFERLRDRMGLTYPRVFLILGNDDGRFCESSIVDSGARGLWDYAHSRRFTLDSFSIYGYCYVPPTPFSLKDWERYDVSRYVEPGCVSPEEGTLSVPRSKDKSRYATIQEDLEALTGGDDLDRALFLFHTPPYQTKLDRAALDGKMVDHAPLDVHVGSSSVRRLIEARQPLVTLHGHIHESSRLTGAWKDRIGRTVMFNAAHDGPELALIRFDLEQPDEATRVLL